MNTSVPEELDPVTLSWETTAETAPPNLQLKKQHHKKKKKGTDKSAPNFWLKYTNREMYTYMREKPGRWNFGAWEWGSWLGAKEAEWSGRQRREWGSSGSARFARKGKRINARNSGHWWFQVFFFELSWVVSNFDNRMIRRSRARES